jgi:hypothetical protein
MAEKRASRKPKSPRVFGHRPGWPELGFVWGSCILNNRTYPGAVFPVRSWPTEDPNSRTIPLRRFSIRILKGSSLAAADLSNGLVPAINGTPCRRIGGGKDTASTELRNQGSPLVLSPLPYDGVLPRQREIPSPYLGVDKDALPPHVPRQCLKCCSVAPVADKTAETVGGLPHQALFWLPPFGTVRASPDALGVPFRLGNSGG